MSKRNALILSMTLLVSAAAAAHGTPVARGGEIVSGHVDSSEDANRATSNQLAGEPPVLMAQHMPPMPPPPMMPGMGPGPHGPMGGPPMGHPHPPGGPPVTGEIFQAFACSGQKLSDEQVEQIAQVKADFADKTSAQDLKIHSLHRQLLRAMTEPQLDVNQINNLHSDLSKTFESIASLHMQESIKLIQILTPEQRKQVRLTLDRQELGPAGDEHRPAKGMPPRPEISSN